MQNQIPKKWQKVKLGEYALLNPTTTLGKGNFPYIPMEDLDWDKKYVTDSQIKEFKGGAKFEEGDILFARITPCLENGKIGKVRNLQGGKGFGSTEYFVIRGKERITDTDFLYYLCRTNNLRQTARNSMIGASGRQRANIESLQNYEVNLPDYSEQKRIASVLSTFDDKIEINNKIAKTLEEMAQILFKEWFIKLQYPDGKLSDIAKITMGQSPSSKFYNENGKGLPFHQGVTNFGSRFPKHEIYCTQNNRIAEKGDILFSVRAPVGRLNIADTKISLGRGVAAIRHKNNYQSYLYYLLKRLFKKEDSLGGGSVFPSVTKDDMEGMKILIPNETVVKKFENTVSNLDKKIELIERENQKLIALRDLLLPKLMKGELRV